MSVLIAVLIVLLVATVVAVVSGPLRQRGGARERGHRNDAAAVGDAEREPPGPRREELLAELDSAREAKYQEIRDAELDYRTGKLSREDFDAVDRTLRAEAIEILDRLEQLDAASGEAPEGPDAPPPR